MKWKYCIKEAYKKINENNEALKFEEKLISKNSTRN